MAGFSFDFGNAHYEWTPVDDKAPLPHEIRLVLPGMAYEEIVTVLRRRYGTKTDSANLFVLAIREAVKTQRRTEG